MRSVESWRRGSIELLDANVVDPKLHLRRCEPLGEHAEEEGLLLRDGHVHDDLGPIRRTDKARDLAYLDRFDVRHEHADRPVDRLLIVEAGPFQPKTYAICLPDLERLRLIFLTELDEEPLECGAIADDLCGGLPRTINSSVETERALT